MIHPSSFILHPYAPRHSRRRGVIFITALGITVVLSGLVLVFAMNMRTEALAAANRQSYAQADAVEQGAERWVLAQVETTAPDAVAVTQIPAEALPVGAGYFWVLHADAESDQNHTYAITDESSKLNLNAATSDQMIQLPGMTDEIADAIGDWVDADSDTKPYGAESDYYSSLSEPYMAKNAPLESVEELLLVKGMVTELLWGYDRNRDGVIDDVERTIGGTGTAFNSAGADGRGLFNYLTVYSVDTNNSSSGSARLNVNSRNVTPLQTLLQNALTATRATQITSRVLAALLAVRGGNAFNSLGDFYTLSGMTSGEFAKVADQLTTTNQRTLPGMVNVNTAPRQVLQCLPGLDSGDADALISKRAGADTSSIAWVFDALTPAKAVGISQSITARSYQYSADIVAVSGDGRAYKRVRIVVDARTLPAKIVYRKDMTSFGWPLPAEVKASLRAGKGVSATGMVNFGNMR